MSGSISQQASPLRDTTMNHLVSRVGKSLPCIASRVCSNIQFSGAINLVRCNSSSNTTNLTTNTPSSGQTCSSSSSSGILISDSGLPEAPTNCCMTGCANCVWIQYADSLIDHYKDGGTKAKEELDRLVTDPSLKMFLRLELISKLNST